jgi:hypothetical protein
MRMHVPLSTLGTLLDLPPGVAVGSVDVGTEGVVVLHLDGDHPSLVATDDGNDTITAEYSVSGAGHRSFTRFVPTAPTVAGPAAEPAADRVVDQQLPAELVPSELVEEARS